MQLFRKLAGNIFFKIILAFVALSFVLFGISGFILGSPNSWVAKVGGTVVSYNNFNSALRSDREIVLANSKSDDTLKYLESDRFKSDVLGRLVNKIMIEKLNEDFGVSASKKIILETVAKDPSFKNQDGKFDHAKFKNFLAKNGFNEERYVNEIANDVVASMVLQTMTLAAPLSYGSILETENFKQEKRVADIITISSDSITNFAKPGDEELQKFFSENKARYAAPEIRKVSYLHFSKKDFAKDLQISDKEIFDEYEKNKEQFTRAETRNFYHVLFETEEQAKAFVQSLNDSTKSDKSKIKPEFAKLAKELAKKDLKAITLSQISQKDLIPQLSESVFKLALNEYSGVLQSPLGFHVFLLNEIKQPQLMPFSEVKASLKQKMAEGREEKIIQNKISAIDDLLLTSNSLSEVAKKFGLKVNPAVKIDNSGRNENGAEVTEIKDLGNFADNAFALKTNQTSKIFYAKNSEGFYALKVEEIIPAHDKNFDEVKTRVASDLADQKKREATYQLAQKIAEEIKANPNSVMQLVAKHHLKIEKNRELPRVSYVSFQGRQIAVPNRFLDQIFSLKPNQSTPVIAAGESEFVIGILHEIKKISANPAQFEEAKKQADEVFRTGVMTEYNSYLLKKYPVKVNEKIFGKKDSVN